MPGLHQFVFRRAVLEKWREKYGQRATYRNLVKSFYNAGKLSLAEAVCEVLTGTCSTNTPQLLHSPLHGIQLVSKSWVCKYSMVFIIAAVCILLALYTSQTADLLNKSHSSCTNMDDNFIFQTELGRPLYSHKARKIAPNNLPHFPPPFVGRDKEVNNIVQLLLDSLVKSVHIVGLPAVGKSTLAVNVGYEMASHGVAVRYINVDETPIFKSCDDRKPTEKPEVPDHDLKTTQDVKPTTSKTSSYTAPSWSSHTDSKFTVTTALSLIEWAKGLSNSTLLILDNCNSLLQEKEGRTKEFLKVFDALDKASPYLHIVTTSNLEVNLLDGKMYKLKPLDKESAIELLQLVSHNVNDMTLKDMTLKDMTLNDSRTINELLDGIPLALKIVGKLVHKRQPNVIIEELQQNLIETLTPEDGRLDKEKMRPVLKLSFNYLDSATQECALYLSHFPGSFSEEAALDIVSNCTNSTPTGCLRNLIDTSLLDQYSYADQPRYKFHNIIKMYLIDVAYQSSQNDDISMMFNSTFVLYYTQLLHYFVTTYNHVPHDDENIGRFEHESHNLKYLLEKVYYFELWTVTSVVELTHAIRCDLMLETFSRSELLKVGQEIFAMFESKMDSISTQIGALKTLNTYRELVVVLRKWIQYFTESDCKSVCEETFLRHGYETRLQTIDNQLSKANISARDFYRELHFSFYSESLCLSYCLHFEGLDHYMVMISICVVLILNKVKQITKRQYSFTHLLADFLLCFGLYADFSPVISVYIAMLVGVTSSGFSVIETLITHHYHRKFFAVLYYVGISILLCNASYKRMISLTFFFYCIAVHVTGWFHNSIEINLLHISTPLYLLHIYFYEIEALRYALSRLVSFVYFHWAFLSSFLPYQLFFFVNCALVLPYYSYAVLCT